MKIRVLRLTSLTITQLHYSSLNALYRWYGSTKNPYEVLGVKRDCSMQDVKQAYIKLCKKLHPDMSPGDCGHQKFVELSAAYATLANAESRSRFDRTGHSEERRRPAQDSYRRRDKEWHEHEEYWKYYHQAHSVNTSNQWSRSLTLAGCFVLVVIGSILNYSAYSSFATNYTRDRVDEKSRKISETYKNIRDKALAGNNLEKIEEMEKKWK